MVMVVAKKMVNPMSSLTHCGRCKKVQRDANSGEFEVFNFGPTEYLHHMTRKSSHQRVLCKECYDAFMATCFNFMGEPPIEKDVCIEANPPSTTWAWIKKLKRT